MVGVLNSTAAKAALAASPHLGKVIANPHWARFMIILAPELLNYAMLYDNGDENIPVTGGWGKWASIGSAFTVTKGDTLKLQSNAANTGVYVGTANKINTQGYVKAYTINKQGGGESAYSFFGANTKMTSWGNIDAAFVDTRTSFAPICVGDINIASMYFGIGVGSNAMFEISGCYMLKPDPWQTWAAICNITSHTTLDALLADSTAMSTLMASEAASQYLMGCTGDLMVSVCNSETAMTALVNNVAYDYAFAHPVWYKFMTMIPTSLAAMDSVCIKVPTMTSNTTPSGTVIYSSAKGTDYAWHAFSGTTAPWSPTNPTDQYIGYIFDVPILLYRVDITNGATSNNQLTRFRVQGSNDGTNWADITGVITRSAGGGDTTSHIIYTDVAYSGYRVYGSCESSTDNTITIRALQIYGKEVTA